MTKYTEINGIQFETIRSDKTPNLIKQAGMYAGRTLWECYENPSRIKEEIYEEWRKWYNGTDFVQGFGVCSFSHHQFSISAVLYCKGCTYPIGAIRITKNHNRLYLFKEN